MRSRPLLVGEANPHSADPEHALYPWPANSAGARMARHLGLTHEDYLNRFERVNLFSIPPPVWSKGARDSAVLYATTLLHVFRNVRVIVLLGERVAAAFGCWRQPWWTVSEQVHYGHVVRFVKVPHPSGRSRAWNDPASVHKLRRILKEFI